MKKTLHTALLAIAAFCLSTASSVAQTLPKVSIEVGETTEPSDLSTTLQIVLLVLSFLRHAMGAHQAPPNQLLVSLALVLTFFIMAPVADRAFQEGVRPYLEEQISGEEAYQKAVAPFRKFMLAQTREQDLALFVGIAGLDQPETSEDIPLQVLVPGFVISEMRTAFQIAFVIFIPFLVIDMVVASVLLSMGMMMLPPIIVSLPFKILLFVLVDGWYLLIKSLVESFRI